MSEPSLPQRRWRVRWRDTGGTWRTRSFQKEKSANDVVNQLEEQGAKDVSKEDRWGDQARFAIMIDFIGVPYRPDLHAELAIQIEELVEHLCVAYGLDRGGTSYSIERDSGSS